MRAKLGMVIASGLGLMGLAGCAANLALAPIRVVEGIVIDNNDKPMKGVIITTDPPSSSVATDEQGRFLLKSLKEGAYTVIAEKVGYAADPVAINVQGFEVHKADIRIVPEGMAVTRPAPAVRSSRKPAVSAESNAASSATESTPSATTDTTKESSGAAAEGTEKKKRWWEK